MQVVIGRQNGIFWWVTLKKFFLARHLIIYSIVHMYLLYYYFLIIFTTIIISEPHKNKGKARKPLPIDAFQILKSKLSLEYELYEFLKARLKLQSRKLKQWRLYKSKKPVIKMDEIRKLKYRTQI